MGLQHRQRIDFDLELRRESEFVIESSNDEVGPSIQTILTPGEYKLRVKLEEAQSHLIKQDCQYIELEIAFNEYTEERDQIMNEYS